MAVIIQARIRKGHPERRRRKEREGERQPRKGSSWSESAALSRTQARLIESSRGVSRVVSIQIFGREGGE